MEKNIFVIIMLSLLIGLSVLTMGSGIIKRIKNHRAPIKTVKAVVIDKNKIEFYSKYSGYGKNERYVIVFSINGKKKSFYVSEFSYYNGYKLREKGTLKYKGDKLIAFK